MYERDKHTDILMDRLSMTVKAALAYASAALTVIPRSKNGNKTAKNNVKKLPWRFNYSCSGSE